MEKLKNFFKNFFNPKDIYSTHLLMFWTCSFEGLFPLKLNKDKTQLESSKIGFTFSFLQLFLYFVSFLLTVCYNQSFVVYFFQTDISVVGGYLQFLSSCVSMVLFYSVAIFRRHKIRMIFQSLYAVDKRFKDLYQAIDHKAVFNVILIGWTVLYSLNLTFVLMSLLLLGTKKDYPNFVVWWSFFFPYLILTVVVVSFLSVVRQILQRFRAVTKVSQKTIKSIVARTIICVL